MCIRDSAFSGPTTPHAAAAASTSGNMNGKYSVASGDRQDVAFNDDYASKGHESDKPPSTDHCLLQTPRCGAEALFHWNAALR